MPDSTMYFVYVIPFDPNPELVFVILFYRNPASLPNPITRKYKNLFEHSFV